MILLIILYTFFFVGELGWELYHPAEHTLALYKALLEAGEEFGVGDFGTYALNTLRIEKGFRMWGAEVKYLFHFCFIFTHFLISLKWHFKKFKIC